MSVQQVQITPVDRQVLELVRRVNPNVKAVGHVSFLAIRGAEPRQRNNRADEAAAVARRLGVFPHVFVQFFISEGSIIYPSPHFFSSEDVPVMLVQIECPPNSNQCCILLDMLEDFLGIPVPGPQRDAMRRHCGLEPIVPQMPTKAVEREEVGREGEAEEVAEKEVAEAEGGRGEEGAKAKLDVPDLIDPKVQEAVRAVVSAARQDQDVPLVIDWAIRNLDAVKRLAKENKPLQLPPPSELAERPATACEEVEDLRRLYGDFYDELFDDDVAYVVKKVVSLKRRDRKTFERVSVALDSL